jgi:hypothetical protein
MSELEALKADVISLVVESWETGEKPFLMSKLGAELVRRGHKLKIALGSLKLTEMIKRDLSDKVRLFADPNDEKVLWAVPANVAHVDPPQRAPAAERPKRLNLDRQIVEAFTTRLDTGMVRMVSFTPLLAVADVHPTTAESAGLPIITSDSLMLEPIATPTDRDRLQATIEAWALANRVETSSLAPRPPHSRRSSGSSLLDAIVEALEPEERARIAMPLDVVAKLMRTPGR